LHPLTYLEEEYNSLQSVVSDLNSYLSSLHDIHLQLKVISDIFSENTKISTDQYTSLIESIKSILDNTVNLNNEYQSIVDMIKKYSGDSYER
jgi:hypothetical protein